MKKPASSRKPASSLMRRVLLRRNVLAVLHGQDDPRAIIQAVTVGLGKIVDALAGGDFPLGQKRLADPLAEFRRAGLGGLERHRNDALEHFEGVIGVTGELAAATGAV